MQLLRESPEIFLQASIGWPVKAGEHVGDLFYCQHCHEPFATMDDKALHIATTHNGGKKMHRQATEKICMSCKTKESVYWHRIRSDVNNRTIGFRCASCYQRTKAGSRPLTPKERRRLEITKVPKHTVSLIEEQDHPAQCRCPTHRLLAAQ